MAGRRMGASDWSDDDDGKASCSESDDTNQQCNKFAPAAAPYKRQLNCQGFSNAKLIQQAEVMFDQIHTLKKKLRLCQQENRRLRIKFEEMKNTAREKDQQALAVTRKTVKLTFSGSVAMGVRKALALTSAASFSLATLIDTSRWTVCRCEVIAWAVIIARAKRFHESVYEQLVQLRQIELAVSKVSSAASHQSAETSNYSCCSIVQAPAAMSVFQTEKEAVLRDCGLASRASSLVGTGNHCSFVLGGTSFCGDATNSTIWKRQKLQGLEVVTMILKDPQAVATGRYAEAFTEFGILRLGFAKLRLCL